MAGGPLSPILNSTFSHSNAPMPADGGSAQPDQGEADQDAGGSKPAIDITGRLSRVSQWSCHSLNMGWSGAGVVGNEPG